MEDENSREIRKEKWRIESLRCKNLCGNNRRNGSAFCQECSDKHKAADQTVRDNN